MFDKSWKLNNSSIDSLPSLSWLKNKSIQPLKSEFLKNHWSSSLDSNEKINRGSYSESHNLLFCRKICPYIGQSLLLVFHSKTRKYIRNMLKFYKMGNSIACHISEKNYLNSYSWIFFFKK